jgi:hypothetical protein
MDLIYNNECWFTVVDICGALTDSQDSGAYWRKLKQRLLAEGSKVAGQSWLRENSGN